MTQNMHTITVIGRQKNGNSQDEQQFTAPCSVASRDGALYLAYTETDEANHQTRVTLKFTASTAVMIRNGAGRTRMEFDPARQTDCDYDTGSGVLPLAIRTQAVACNLNERGGHARLNYTLYYGGSPLSDNEVLIRLQPINPDHC